MPVRAGIGVCDASDRETDREFLRTEDFWIIVAAQGAKMNHKSGPHGTAEAHVREIRRATRKQCGAEEKICIVLDAFAANIQLPSGVVAKGSRRDCIASGRRILEAGKKRLSGDTARQATSSAGMV